jgi:ubiquinone/menaquinone biosynthesis C-methylase UbiE
VPAITSTSIIHDNASGPGTVAREIMSHFPHAPRPTIRTTDFPEVMISGLQEDIASMGWQESILASIMDSESLAFDDDTFTHSITNFALFILPSPEKAARDIFRTLKPGGTAALTAWKANGFVDLIHRTQKRIRPDLPELIIYDEEWNKSSKLQSNSSEAL